MKTKDVIIISCFVTLLILGVVLFYSNSGVKYGKDNPIPFDCSKPFSPIYLRSSEKGLASEILNTHQNTFVVISEQQTILSRSDFVECKNLNFDKYLNQWGWNN